jgi:hypothetical protein
MRFARLIHRPVRVLGGPSARAACGGNLMPALVDTLSGMAGPVKCKVVRVAFPRGWSGVRRGPGSARIGKLAGRATRDERSCCDGVGWHRLYAHKAVSQPLLILPPSEHNRTTTLRGVMRAGGKAS